MSEKLALLAAGGTGGHLFPAQALALELKSRGWRIHLATDTRVEAYGQDFPAEETHLIASATLTREPIAFTMGVLRLGIGFLQAWSLIGRLKPNVAVGFGGYPTLPPMLAAALAGVPTVIHDQNAVIGRANGFLAPRVTAIATSQAAVRGTEKVRGKDRADRQSGAAGGSGGGGDALSGAGRQRSLPAPGLRRQPGRPLPVRFGAAGDRPAARGSAGAARHRAAVPAGGHGARRGGLQGSRRRRRRWRPSSATCRSALPTATSWSAARARRPSPNSRSSAGRRSWCRCPVRSIRTRRPTPWCWRPPAVAGWSSRRT